jgi:glyoxylase-like metal-dependent hydrolase (beta-lactamase superfamily II)
MPLPHHLAETHATGIHPGETIAQFEIGDMRNFVYLILDWKTREAAIVDPQRDLSPPLNALREHGFTLKMILLTHSHFDHVAGVPELLKKYPHLKIQMSLLDFFRLERSKEAKAEQIENIQDGQFLRLGSVEIQALHTPGHSAGEISYLVDQKYLLTGDTLFIRECGRTDMETGSDAQMFASLQRIKALAPETIILPGHHYVKETASTLANELLTNAPLLCRSVKELAELPKSARGISDTSHFPRGQRRV